MTEPLDPERFRCFDCGRPDDPDCCGILQEAEDARRKRAQQSAEQWQPPRPRTELLWAGIDLDGTLAEGVWTPSSSGREIGAPIERNVRKLEALRSAGYKTVIHSSRGWEHYEAVEAWLEFYRIPYDRIVLGKLLAAVYCDDRAIYSEDESWLPRDKRPRCNCGDKEVIHDYNCCS